MSDEDEIVYDPNPDVNALQKELTKTKEALRKAEWELELYKEWLHDALEERPKGKWLPKGRWHIDPQCIEYTCSICGRRIMREERLNVIEQYPFCHCGADMRGKK